MAVNTRMSRRRAMRKTRLITRDPFDEEEEDAHLAADFSST